MKKIIWLPVLIVVLAAVWLGASWYSGKRTETELNQRIALLNNAWAASGGPASGTILVTRISYERGLFSSHARYALLVGALPPDQDQPPEIDLTVRHGPFPSGLTPRQFALHAELATTGFVKTLSDTAMGGKPPLVIDATCAYRGRCTGTGQIPAINFVSDPEFKLAFGGVRVRFNLNWHSETDYQSDSSAQLLPLSINGQNFGSGEFTDTRGSQSLNETLSWKNDQGESKLALSITTTRPVTSADFKAVKPENMADFLGGVIKTASVHLMLSKPMLLDLSARVLALLASEDLAVARRDMDQQLDAALTSDPKIHELVQLQGDTLASDWRYADGKLTINGKENPEALARFKQAFADAMRQSGRYRMAPDEQK